MALSRVTRFNSASLTAGAFTPADNTLVTVIASATDDDGVSGMVGTNLQITGVGLTWTSRVATTASPSWAYGARAWTAQVGTGASITISVASNLGAVNDGHLLILEYSGHDVATPVGATGIGSVGSGPDGAQSVTLSGVPAATSETLGVLIGTVNSGSVTVSEGAGWTELYDSPFTDWTRAQAQALIGLGSTTVPWADVATGTGDPSSSGIALMALEIRAAAIAASSRLTLLGAG